MFLVEDVYDEAKKIIGSCDDAKLFRWLGDAVSLICNKADLEGWKGYLDICSSGCGCDDRSRCPRGIYCGKRVISMPREVETVIGVNIQGKPALGYGSLFNFHLNGPGDCGPGNCLQFSWMDGGDFHVTYRDLVIPAKLVAYTSTKEDNGKTFIVYGFDTNGQVLRHQINGVWANGALIPMIYGYAIPDVDAPTISRITGIYKAPTVGGVRLSTIDDGGTTGVLLSVLEPDETLPQYRRIIINRPAKWVRIAYMKTNPLFYSRADHVTLRSRRGLLCAVQAVKHYSDNQLADAHGFEADAARMEIEAQQKVEATGTFMPMQVVDLNGINDKTDRFDIR